MAIGIKYSSALKDFDPGKYIRDFWDDYAKEWNKQQEVIEKNEEQFAGLEKYNFDIVNSADTKALYDNMNTVNSDAADALRNNGLTDPDTRERVRKARLTTIANVTEIGNRVNAYNKAYNDRLENMKSNPYAVYKKTTIGYDDFANGLSKDEWIDGSKVVSAVQGMFDAQDHLVASRQTGFTKENHVPVDQDDTNPLTMGQKHSTTYTKASTGYTAEQKAEMIKNALNLRLSDDNLNMVEKQLRNMYNSWEGFDKLQKRRLVEYMYQGAAASVSPDNIVSHTTTSDIKATGSSTSQDYIGGWDIMNSGSYVRKHVDSAFEQIANDDNWKQLLDNADITERYGAYFYKGHQIDPDKILREESKDGNGIGQITWVGAYGSDGQGDNYVTLN